MFSDRPDDFVEEYLKMSSGFIYAHERFNTEKTQGVFNKGGVAYSGNANASFAIRSEEMQVEFTRINKIERLSIWKSSRKEEVDFGPYLKLIQTYNSHGNYTNNIKSALKERIDASKFSDVKPRSRYCIAINESGFVTLKPKEKLRQGEEVLPWEINFVSRQDRTNFVTDKVSKIVLKPNYDKLCLFTDRMKNVNDRRSSVINLIKIRENIFDPFMSFSILKNGSYGIIEELKSFMDYRLFTNSPKTVDLTKKENLMMFQIDSRSFAEDVIEKRRSVAVGIRNIEYDELEEEEEERIKRSKAISEMIHKEKTESAEESETQSSLRSEESDSESSLLSDIDLVLEEPEEGSNLQRFDDEPSFDATIISCVKSQYKHRSKNYLFGEVKQAQERLMQQYSKQVVIKVLEKIAKRERHHDLYNACVYLSIVLAWKMMRTPEDDWNVGEDFLRNYSITDQGLVYKSDNDIVDRKLSYPDLCDDRVMDQMRTLIENAEDLKEHVDGRFKRLRESCVMYACNTLAGSKYLDGPVSSDLEKVTRELFSKLKIEFDEPNFIRFKKLVSDVEEEEDVEFDF
jgi:hypothetical protein